MKESSKNKKSLSKDEKDWFLEQAVDLANTGVFEIGITLNIGGAVVSGILTSGASFFEGIAKEARQAISNADKEVLSKLADLWEMPAQAYKPKDNEKDGSPRSWGFIHLREARFHAPGQSPIPGNGGVFWRGKLSSIDGFSLGNLQTSGK